MVIPPVVALQFQFHEGPIKTQPSEDSQPFKYGFNSMKVRLKRGFNPRNNACLLCFNYMKVRLKP